MLDLRVLLLAAIVASPAIFRAAQGLVTVNEALVRILTVILGTTVVALLVRVIWPVVNGVVPDDTDAVVARTLAMADLAAATEAAEAAGPAPVTDFAAMDTWDEGMVDGLDGLGFGLDDDPLAGLIDLDPVTEETGQLT